MKNSFKFLLMLMVITSCIMGMTVISNAATTKEGVLLFEDVKASYWYADAVCNSNVKASQMTHDYAAANCGKPETCKRCGVTRGKATGNHNWWAATCTKPKVCKVCYQTSDSALGHYAQNTANTSCLEFVKCSRCGEKRK